MIKLQHRFPGSHSVFLPMLKVLQGLHINMADYQASDSDFKLMRAFLVVFEINGNSER